ncbi:hypothetical protein [Azohydromonas australica]|uniref:hypothetical protein n=1 Tax=Azohydromonas australica TaxID=364039 RepID=UPI00040F598F|nr:hypothetical protein [Azohydromonas australica]
MVFSWLTVDTFALPRSPAAYSGDRGSFQKDRRGRRIAGAPDTVAGAERGQFKDDSSVEDVPVRGCREAQ